MPPQVARVEDRSRHACLRDRALDAVAVPPSERILAEPEDSDLLDLGKRCQHAQLREHADVTAAHRRPGEIGGAEEDPHARSIARAMPLSLRDAGIEEPGLIP